MKRHPKGSLKWTNCLVALCWSSFSLAQQGFMNEAGIDYSKCDNCTVFPKAYMMADSKDLLDFSGIDPEKQLHFLEGEWQLYYPAYESVGFEIFDWFSKGKVLQGYQDWSLHPDHLDKIPFRAKSFFRYLTEEERWEMTWITSSSTVIYSGNLVSNQRFELYENQFKGNPLKLKVSHPFLYVFRNITKNSFVAEYYETQDNGKTYPFLLWRLYYKRRN